MDNDLLRLIAEASVLAGGKHPCNVLGHNWAFRGGANCGCEGPHEDGGRWSGTCSVPVYECSACGDCDYGDNAEAVNIRTRCNDEVTDEQG